MISIGDKLICKKEFEIRGFLPGKIYTVLGVESDGNMNIYIQGDNEWFTSTCFSGVEKADMNLPYSDFYVQDYFEEIIEVRNRKIEALGI